MLTLEGRVNGETVAPINDWGTIKYVELDNRASGFSISIPRESQFVPTLLEAEDSTDLIGVVIGDTDTGRLVPCVATRIPFTSDRSDFVTVTGVLDLALVNEKPPFPNPANQTNPWGTTAYWEATGEIADITADFLDEQVGPSAAAGWRFFDAVTSTAATTPTASLKARMTPNCLEYLEPILTPLGVTIEPRFTGGQSTLHVRETTDRPDIVFSPALNTVTKWSSATEQPGANVVFAGGTGSGTTRNIAVSDQSGGKWPRKRGVYVERPTLSGAELAASAAAQIAAFEPYLKLESITSADGLVYGDAYYLGDTCRVEIAGVRQTATVTGVATTATADGETTRTVELGHDLNAYTAANLFRRLVSTYGLSEIN